MRGLTVKTDSYCDTCVITRRGTFFRAKVLANHASLVSADNALREFDVALHLHLALGITVQ